MAGHRILYLAVLLCCGAFSVAYGRWLAGILMLTLLGLPWLSLLLSLPAMVRFRLQIEGASAVTMGEEAEVWLVGSSLFPLPPFRSKLELKHCITGERGRYAPHQGLPTAHCGGLIVTVARARVCDYLGLFAVPLRRRESRRVLVRPRPLPVKDLPDLRHYIASSWQPKFGGGFAENHELRLYRPGDSLNQVHWKLSAKTGKLTIREAMEPRRGLVLLTMDLRGTPEELDRKFGRLLWLGSHIVSQGVHFEIRALTGEGVQTFPICGERDLRRSLDKLLCAPMAQEGSIRDQACAASWQYHIGGEASEA